MISEATTFRLDNIRTRSLKTTYKHLSPIEKQYIKLHEKLIQSQKAIMDFWGHIKRDESNRASPDNNWDFYHLTEATITKIESQIKRFLIKSGWTTQKANKLLIYHRDMNISHCYGGSY